MGFRVTQQMLYTNSLNSMNNTLSQLLESNTEAASQKKINKPSDDPVGMTRVLSDRDSLSSIDQYGTNVSTAKGWLNLADNTLVQVSTVVTTLTGLAEQAATGTLSADNRAAIGSQVRQLFDELVAMANTQYDGKSIFGGQKTDTLPFAETLGLTSNTPGIVSNAGYKIDGASQSTIVLQFLSSGTLSNASPYRYSNDGGNTWTQGTVTDPGAPNKLQLSLGGVNLELDRNTSVVANSATNTNDTSGSWMWIRPTAQYVGDDADHIAVDPMQGMGSTVTGTAQGIFNNNVLVRVDQSGTLASNVSYSYSLDGGVTWKLSNTSTPDSLASSASLNLPGGVLTLHSNGGNQLTAGNIFVVRPRTALIDFDISPTEQIAVNGVGKNIFGGVYQDPASNSARPVVIAGSSGASNLFETVGKLVGFLESNNQSGVQQALADLRSSHQNILNYAADVGARENRLDVASGMLDNLKSNETQQLSNTEDVDISTLMTKLAQQQLAYQSVLKSTSMILNMSLMNYL